MDFPSMKDLQQIGRDEILARQSKLTVDAVDRDGSDANVLVASSAAIGDQVVTQLINVAADSFLDSAEKQGLTRLVFDRYGLIRLAAAPALGSVQFSTTAPSPSTFTIQSGLLLQTADGIQFITTQPATFLVSTTGPVVVPVRSVLAGANQQAQIGAIANIVGQVSGQPSDFVVTNIIATAGAADEETDASLRNRARNFFVNARRATKSAIVQGALAVPGVASASVFEVLDGLGRPARYVILVVTDNYTDQLANLGVVPPTYQAQSQQLALTVFNGLDDVRAAGIYVQVQVAQVILQPVVLSLSFVAGVDVESVANAARAAMVNVINGLAPGVTLTPAMLRAALGPVNGLVLTGNEIVSPPGQIVPRPLQVLRTSLALVTAAAYGTSQPITASSNPDAAVQA